MKHVLLLLLTIIGFAECVQGAARRHRHKKPRTQGAADVSSAKSTSQSGSALPGRTLSTVVEEADAPLGDFMGSSGNPYEFQVPAARPLIKDCDPVTSEQPGSYHPETFMDTLGIKKSPGSSPSSSLDSSASRVSSFGGLSDSFSLSRVLSPAPSPSSCVKPTAPCRLEGVALVKHIQSLYPQQTSIVDRVTQCLVGAQGTKK